MKELITRVEELAVELNNAKRTIEEADFAIREHAEIRVQLVQDGFKASSEIHQLRAEVGNLREENKKLAAQIEDAEVIQRRERLIKSLNEEITKRDHELREMDADAKKHREGLQAKENEINEWLAQLERARQERDAALLEVAKLRAEVPLESTREALKNAVAKLQEVTIERDNAQRQVMTDRAFISGCYECAKKHGIKDGEYFDQFIMRIASALQEVTTERDQAEADAKTVQADAQRLGDECARLAGKVAELEAQIKVTPDFTSKVMRK